MIRRFGEFILRRRFHAALVALLCSIIPLMGWLSVVIVSMVTLRKGAREGLFVLLWSVIPDVAYAITNNPMVLVFSVVCSGLLVWVYSVVLREWVSWQAVLHLSMVVGAIGVGIVHILMPDIVVFWMKTYLSFQTEMATKMNLHLDMSVSQIKSVAMAATGITGAFLSLNILVNLFLARCWQGSLFNPKGLRPELYSIRLSAGASAMVVFTGLLIFVGVDIARDILPILLLPYMMSGLSFLHACAAIQGKAGNFWLIGFYVLFVIVPYVMVLVVLIALFDSVLNFRHRLAIKVRKR